MMIVIINTKIKKLILYNIEILYNMFIPKWKQESTNSIIPTNSRPFHNKDKSLIDFPRTPFKPNPIKHWRKQLLPYYKTSSKQVSIDMIDAPSSSVHVNKNVDCANNNIQLLKENVNLLNTCYGSKEMVDGEMKCSGGTNHIKRSANTNIKKNYYTSHKQYLKSRCKSHEQNQIKGKKINKYVYEPSQCSLKQNNCSKKIIYKPSNSAFSMQGAASASANTQRLKNKTLINNEYSLLTAYGRAPKMVRDYYSGETGYDITYVKGNTNNPNSCQMTFKSCN